MSAFGIDSKSSFQVGGTFTFVINPSRNGSPTGLLLTLIFPDGRKFNVKNTGTRRGTDVAQLSIDLAERIVEHNLDRDTQLRLVDSFINQVGSN